MHQKLLFIFGTRPEAIKMAPLILEFKNSSKFLIKICVTAQHREMLDNVLSFFNITPDFDLNIMKVNQNLFELTVNAIKGIENILSRFQPDVVFIQGDTTTAFISTIAAYYKKIKVAHIEAGLRSGNKYSPFPEEINRILTSHIADFHFAPTEKAKKNLEKEGIKKNIWVVGNTVIDALFLGIDIIKKGKTDYIKYFKNIDFNKKIILITSHRRESFGQPFRNICNALRNITKKYNDVEIIYPVHLNPNVRRPVFEILSNLKNVHLLKPLEYQYFLWLMDKSYIILTDSGGVQEEAPSLGKPVLVMREVTEREEGIKAGTAQLVGTESNNIVKAVTELLLNNKKYNNMAKAINPYGDGKTSKRIVDIMSKQ